MKEKYFSYKYLISIIILFTCLFIFSTPSLALIPGDFGSAGGGPPDGCVDFEDLMIFAMAYGSTPADSNWNVLCDIASQGGVLQPDGVIDFEDLMIFAMHYGEGAPPSAPTLSDPGITLPSSATYTVSWSAVTTATSYVLQEATSSGFTSGLQEYSLTDTSESFSHTVSATTTYYYRVAAINDYGQGDWSNVEGIDIITCSSPPVTEVTALGFTYHSSYMSVVQSIISKLIKENRIHESYPLIPKKIERTDVVYEIYIEWAEYTEDKPNGYKVYKSIDGGSYQLIVEGDADADYGYYSFTDTTVTEGSTYSYYITAYGSGWETCFSEPAITTVLPWCSLTSPLDGVTIKNNPTPTFSWSPVNISTFPYGAISYGDSDLRVKDTTIGGESWYILFNNMTLSTTTYGQDGQAIPLVSGHNYTWNSCGYGYDGSNNLIAISCSEDWGFDYCTAPSPPILSNPGTNLPSSATYTVSWSAVTTATSYVLQEATSSDFISGFQEYTLFGTSKSFSYTVSTTTTYYYRVASVNSCGQSGWSNVENITVVTGPVHNLNKNTYYDTIQEALNDADSLGGDIIEVDDGTYNESITFPAGKLVTLQSASGIRDNVIIQGANNLSTVTINNSSTGTTLSGFTITHTGGNTGRGIHINSGNLIVDNCIISGNTVDWGGGGIFNGGTLDITSSNISDNTADSVDSDGGGIYNYYGTLTITSSTISGNSVDSDGGGIYNHYGTLTITSSTIISGNTANHGGGICNYDGTSTITSSVISDNSAIGSGGGICNSGTLTITSSTISGNIAAAYGGGIFNRSGGSIDIISSTTISDNIAGYYGGGIYNYYGTSTITGSTISGNTATHGSGICNNGGTSTITESIISYNTADYGGGIYNKYGTLTITSSTISDNSAIEDGGGIYNQGGILTIIASTTISGNTANWNGGGIYNWDYGTLTIIGSTIFGNTADTCGGGIYNYYYGTSTITSSTISDNTAIHGGGIYNYFATSTITSSTISGNSVTGDGGGIYNAGTLTITSSTISGNDVTGSGGGIYISYDTITIGGSHYLDFGNFNAFTYNKKNGIISADQHIRDLTGDCRSSYPYNYYNPN